MTEVNRSPWGLDVLDSEDKINQEKMNALQQELNKQYSLCFSTPTGKKVLEHLIKCTIEQPTWIPSNGNLDGQSTIQYGFVREGQNSIVRNIIDRINSIKNKQS